jgi:hypothetical protein
MGGQNMGAPISLFRIGTPQARIGFPPLPCAGEGTGGEGVWRIATPKLGRFIGLLTVVLSTQHSALSTQYSALSTQYSVLSTFL